MARMPYVDKSDLAEADRYLLDRPINLFRTLANNPEAMKVFAPVGRWIRHECPLDPRLREMAILQVGYVTSCAYEFSHHVKIGADFGVRPEDIEAIIAETEGRASTLSPLESAVLRAARELTRDVDLSEETWSALESGLGRQRAMEAVLVITYYNHVVRLLRAFRIDVEPDWAAPLDTYAPIAGQGGWR